MATCRPTFNVKTLTVGFRPLSQTTRGTRTRRRWLTLSRTKVEAAYARSDLFERRRLLMDDRSEYLGGHADSTRR